MVEKLIIGVAVVLLVPSLLQFVSAVRRKGSRFLGDLGSHAKAQIASRRIWLPILSILAMLLLPFSLAAGKPAAVTAVLCISGGMILHWITPPTVLLLGVSGSKCNELLPVLAPAIFPAKVVHLLRDNYYDPARGYDLKLHTVFSTSRASGAVAWEHIVSIYLGICDKVLVDVREHSGNLHVELSMIGALSDKTKVLYLVDEKTERTTMLNHEEIRQQVCPTLNDAIWRMRTGY